MESQQSPQLEPLVDPVLNFIRQSYLPASNETATIRMSTLEIGEAIRSHTGMEVSLMQLYKWLIEQGYTYTAIGNMQMEWLMKDVER